MTDLIERLRRTPCTIGGDHPDLHEEAADEIERLRAVVDAAKKVQLGYDSDEDCPFCSYDELQEALAALETDDDY